MSKKKKTSDKTGTYVLCITVGAIVGIGIGPAVGGVLISAPIGLFFGVVAGYLLTHRKITRKKRH